jgi:hypothetical protein
MVLDAYESALREHPARDHRFRIEHAQVVAPEDIHRFAELGVIAAMQPSHATSDMDWAPARLGEERLEGAYAWRSMLEAGVRLAFGSDFPVESLDPLEGVYAAVTRQDRRGRPKGGWIPEQRLTLEEALEAFTAGPAWAAFFEKEAGTLEVGKLADVTCFDRDLFAVRPADWLHTEVLYTVVGGQVVYARPQGFAN